MKLNVDFFQLNLSAAKMQGLGAVLNIIRENKLKYQEGLDIACEYVRYNNGSIEINGKTTHLTLHDQSAYCFQPYPDINIFYFES